MKTTKLIKSYLNEKGFTLIELMIVVGIIGILVAIAAPNFARYQSKARQSEAKIGLSAIYAGEKSFYSEYSAYISSMDGVGYTPEGSKRYYSIGFSSADTASVTGYSGAYTTPSFKRVSYPSAWSACSPDLAGSTSANTDGQTFSSAAQGQVRMGQSCDFWQITDLKVLTNNTINL